MSNSEQDAGLSESEHFSDASEGRKSGSVEVPKTRLERVDHEPSHGEVPGTEAYQLRESDAMPDEVEVIPDSSSQSATPGTGSVPMTVIEKVDPEEQSHGEVPGTEAFDKRQADAEPDVIRRAPEAARTDVQESPTSSRSRSEHDVVSDAQSDTAAKYNDDFDEFEEGDDDFGAFDEGTTHEQNSPQPSADLPTSGGFDTSSPAIAVPNFTHYESGEEIRQVAESLVQNLFPSNLQNSQNSYATYPEATPSFLTERSQSLWSQLVAPPPLQPPNWVRSRIRRLFFVSLGVPVDLDEILPASKQKKLVLPSQDLEADRTTRKSHETTGRGSLADVKRANDSSTSVNASPSRGDRKRRGPPPPPDFDLNSARLLCSTTDTALQNFTDQMLQRHVVTLNELKHRAGDLLEYWLIQRDSARGDKEAFEEVIENLVKHAKKIRK